MSEFRAGNSRVLIATDIWGRGNNKKPFSYFPRVGCSIGVFSHQLWLATFKRIIHPQNRPIRKIRKKRCWHQLCEAGGCKNIKRYWTILRHLNWWNANEYFWTLMNIKGKEENILFKKESNFLLIIEWKIYR